MPIAGSIARGCELTCETSYVMIQLKHWIDFEDARLKNISSLSLDEKAEVLETCWSKIEWKFNYCETYLEVQNLFII